MKKLILVLLFMFMMIPTVWAGRSFNGTTDIIQVTANNSLTISGTDTMTMVCWFKVSVLPASEAEICGKGGHGVNQGYYINLSQSGHTNNLGAHWFQNQPLNHGVDVFCGTVIAINTWYSVVIMFGGNANPGAFLILNGSICSTSSTNNTLGGGSTSIDFCIGGYASGSGACNVANFAGIISEVAVWNVVLGTINTGVSVSAKGALALGKICPVGPSSRRAGFPQPIGYWPLYGSSGSLIEPDFSGNSFHGTLVGTTPADHAPCVP